MNNGLPFKVKLNNLNKTTIQAIEDTMNGIDIVGLFNSVKDLMDDLNAQN